MSRLGSSGWRSLRLVTLLALLAAPGFAAPWTFQVTLGKSLPAITNDGRLFVVLGHTNSPEPRTRLTRVDFPAPETLARDLPGLGHDKSILLDSTAFSYPTTNLSTVPAADYFVQAVYSWNPDMRYPGAPGDLFSRPHPIHFDPAVGGIWKLELTEQVQPEPVSDGQDLIRVVRIPSKRLSAFHGRPITLRVNVLLPRDYDGEPSRRYPLWVHIGGLNARSSIVFRWLRPDSLFRQMWFAEDTPRVILLQLDGIGPNGDPYFVNSDNNGPYGDALTEEVIPHIEAAFRAIGQPRVRFLSGVSTGAWVSLALQIFYPDYFNGAWAACPDPVDFRALELVNIYEDENAYVNRFGNERPSARDSKGDVQLTMRREVGFENLLGRGNSYTLSGQQWGAWNCVYGPRSADGRPVPLWDPQTGKIDHAVAEHWKKYDLRLVLEANWKTLAPKLNGKLHISAGEADGYFLNNAVRLLEESLAKANPPFVGKIVFGPGQGHGWSDLTDGQMLDEMQARAAGP